MSDFSKTNGQLEYDASIVRSNVTALQTKTNLNISTVSTVGLKDGSGTNGDVIFVPDSSTYIKISGGWYFLPCSSLGLGI